MCIGVILQGSECADWCRRTVRAGTIVLALSSNCAASVVAAGDAGELEHRTAFVAAEQALDRGNRSQFRKRKEELKDYVLYPYLVYWELRRYLSYAKPAQVASFLERYDDTPLAAPLRASWLRLLARREQWQAYIDAYRPSDDVSAQCRLLYALLQVGRSDEALRQVPALWINERSQPRACDPVFEAWMGAGHLTEDMVWQRVRLAMAAGQSSLARYLARFLDETDQRWVALWRRVHRNPALIDQQALFEQAHAERERVLLHGLRRLARDGVDRAAATWQRIRDRYAFTAEQRHVIERDLALHRARNGDAGALRMLRALPEEAHDDRTAAWQVISALRDGEWNRAHESIERLLADDQNAEQWRYWKARILEALNRDEEASRTYASLASTRSYYGFLAADRLGTDYELAEAPLPGTDEDVARLLRDGAVRRAHELRAVGHLADARREWHLATRRMSRNQLLHAAKLAQHWGWHDRAIFTAAKAQYWDDLNARFPLAYLEPIEREAEARDLDTAWLMAMLRQESAFMRDARSSAGALGLMQLMPRTARTVARRINAPIEEERDLLLADVNIRLGSEYLRTVLARFDDNPVLATAAYNAGPHRVTQWIPKDQLLPADLWIETVPYAETRNYLRRVLAYTAIYEHRMGLRPTRLHDRMRPIGDSSHLLTGMRQSRRSADAS